MIYYLFKLHFTAPVHFGDSKSAVSLSSSEMTFSADRLFSALCITGLHMDDSLPDKLTQLAREGNLKFSDAFPYHNETLYLPRPCLEAKKTYDSDASERKVMKKVKYLSLEQYPAFLRSLEGLERIRPATLKASFGEETTIIRAAVEDGVDAVPYAVGQFRFNSDCGLYFIAGMHDENTFLLIEKLLRNTGYSGIGGKTSSGYGSFEVVNATKITAENAETKILYEALNTSEADCWISLTTSLPKNEELEEAMDGALFQIVRKAGFVFTDKIKTPHKKQEQLFFSSGSTFLHTYTGDVYNVAPANSPHPVYRYAVPLFMGVSKTWLNRK